MSIEINSKENNTYKEIKKLQSNKNYFYIEGKKLFLEAVKAGLKFEKIIIDKNNINSFSDLNLNNAEIIFMKNDLIAGLYTTDTKPSKEDLIISIVRCPTWSKDQILSSGKNLIFLEQIQDPGNLGTIIRSCSAFNSGGIILSKDSVSYTNTKVIRSSAGGVFTTPILFIENPKELIDIGKDFSYNLTALVKEKGEHINKINKTPSIFLFGNEGKGLSSEILKIANNLITIPQSNNVESLNLATAVSIVLWNSYN